MILCRPKYETEHDRIFGLALMRLQGDALRAFPSSPRQKAINVAMEKLRRIEEYARA